MIKVFQIHLKLQWKIKFSSKIATKCRDGGLKRKLFSRLVFQFVYNYYVGRTILHRNDKSFSILKLISLYTQCWTLFLAVISVSMNKRTFGTNGIMIILWSTHRTDNNNRIRFTFTKYYILRKGKWNSFNV